MDLLNQLENEVRGISDFEMFAFEVSQEITRIRDVVAGLAPLRPLSLTEESTPLVRVLGSLALFILRRNPVDLLEMPRRDHLATEGVFMLASYWAGLSTSRIRLDKRLCSGAIRDVLASLEVAALTSKSVVLPQAPLAFQISVEDSPRGNSFDLYINKSAIARPFGATWRVESDQTSDNTSRVENNASADIATNPEVMEYLFSDYEVTMSSAEGKVVIRRIPKPAQRSGQGDRARPKDTHSDTET
jgi:hypothetical protein